MEKQKCNLHAILLLGMVVHLSLLGTTSGSFFGRSSNRIRRALAEKKPPPNVTLDNGIVRLTLSNPGGLITGISFGGIDNLLEANNEEDDRGYWDVAWNKLGSSTGDRVPKNAAAAASKINSPTQDMFLDSDGMLSPTEILDKLSGTEYKVIMDDADQKEVSIVKNWTANLGDSTVPINIDKRFVLLKGSSGFYTYAIMERLDKHPGCDIQEMRLAFKLSSKFNYMAISDPRQRYMPSMADRNSGRVLDYKEAVQLTNSSNPDFNGEVDDKYLYSAETKDSRVHGWVNTESGVGFWVIMPSDEFRVAGPSKQELTSHVGPTSHAMFASAHYGGSVEGMQFQYGERWKKVMGPVFIYFNKDDKAKSNPTILWEDAKATLAKESGAWPYKFPLSQDFLKAHQRGAIKGQLQVRDRVNGSVVPANGAFVGLAVPGDAGSWQVESQGYQFWTKTDDKGNFVIKNIRPGKYSLYGYVSGYIGDYKHTADINIAPGSHEVLPRLVFEPPRNGPTLWEIGHPDRSASEFYIPDPPAWVKPHPFKLPNNRWRQYGLWERYSDLYRKGDLVFKIGTSFFKNDWFYAHVPRKIGNNIYQGTTWQIVFDLQEVQRGSYTFHVAIASASTASLMVRVNHQNNKPLLETGLIGKDNAIARHGIHGLYYLYSVNVPDELLVKGKNTIYLTQTRFNGPYIGMMYDYLRFEAPPAPKRRKLSR